MKTLLCSLFLACYGLTVVAAEQEIPKEYTMATSRPSAVVKLYDGHLDSEQRRAAKPHVFDKQEAFFEFLWSIPSKSTIYWTTYCDVANEIFIGKNTILKKDIVERLKRRDIVLHHRVEFF